jgi:tetratricopeptide (TPR) repeat protein
MDIWEWLGDETLRLTRDGQGRLARGLMRLPSLVCDDRHQEVDALAPELLAQARALGLPWIEIFVRHWHLQSRVLHRSEGESALAEAVSLMELSHRDANRGCPQSVCSVQDLTVCYSFTDGPGYAEERIQVTDETLARIDPSWACFGCISGERADALLDQGRGEEALVFLDRQVAARVVAGQKDSLWTTAPQARMAALSDLGRFDELLSFIQGCEKEGRHDAHERLRYRIMRARAFTAMGRLEEARSALPAVAEVEPTPVFYGRWTATMRALVEAGGMPNEASLGRSLRAFAARLLRQGVYRETLHLLEHTGKLALLRGAPHVARRAVEAMRNTVGKLRKPLDALDRIGRLEQAISGAGAPAPLPDTPEATLAQLGDDFTSEATLDVLERAHAAWPDQPELTSRFAHALDLQGFEEEALSVLRAAVRRGTSSIVAMQLGSMLASSGDFEEATHVAEVLSEAGAKPRGLWVLSRIAHEQGRYEACAEHLDALLADEPERVAAHHMRIDAARKMRDFAAMLRHVEALLELCPSPGLHWDRMLAATITGQWSRVRRSAIALGMPFEEGDEPIDTEGSLCRIRYEGAGEMRELWAKRTGPVTARIVQITAPDVPSRTNDVVAFEAAPLNAPPATEEGRDGHTWLYPHVATLTEGRCTTFTIDGVFPGEEEWQKIRGLVGDLGALIQTQSGESYVLARPGAEAAEVRGLYAFVAAPRDVSLSELHALLLREAAALADPLVWPALAEAAGDNETAARHRAIAEAWRL